MKLLWAALLASLAVAGYTLYRLRALPKVGIVDNALLMQQFSEAIRARGELQVERQKWTANSKIIEDSLKVVMEAMGKAEHESAKTREALAARLDKWNKEYNDYATAVQQMAPKLEAEKLRPVLDKLNMFVQNWGREHGYAAILGTGNGGVILMRESAYDVTTQVLTGLNALYGPGVISQSQPKDTSPKPLKAPAHDTGAKAHES